MRLGWLVLLLGCGRVGFDASTAVATGPADGAQPTDASSIPGGGGPVVPAGSGADAGLCTSLAQLTYAFDGTGSALWSPSVGPGMTLSESGNQLVIPLPASKVGTAGYFSACTYDLHSQRVFVTAATVPTVGTATDMYLAVGTQGDATGVNITGGHTQAYRINGAAYTQLASVTYNPTAHKVLQVRESGGVLFYEVSPDGTTFTTLFSGPPPFDVSAVQLLLFADTGAKIASPGTAAFANLDIP
jgi:hypothetical protein